MNIEPIRRDTLQGTKVQEMAEDEGLNMSEEEISAILKSFRPIKEFDERIAHILPLLFQGMNQSEKGFKRIRVKESDHGRLTNDYSTWKL